MRITSRCNYRHEMSLIKDNVVYGSVDTTFELKQSLGRFFFDCLKKRNPEEVINISVDTKEERTVGDILKNAVKVTEIFNEFSVCEDDVVAIISENAVNNCEPILAGLWTGVVINPINPAFSIGELKHALEISRPKLIFCSTTALTHLVELQKQFVFMKTIIVMNSECDENDRVVNYQKLLERTAYVGDFVPKEFDTEDETALILLSSGTSGFPKCVLLTRANLRSSLEICFFHHRDLMHTTRNTTVLLLSFYHVAGLMIQLFGVAVPMKMVSMKTFAPELFLRTCEQYKATLLFLVPSVLSLLVKNPIVDDYDLSSVKKIMWGAAACPNEVLKLLSVKFNDVIIQQGYGLTESTCLGLIQAEDKPDAVGHVVVNMCAKVCDPETKEKLGPLQHGEICLKGSTIMKGYLNNEIATTNCMDDEGFLHTGDLGYYDNDGYFYIIDRIKEIIKYNGYQVPPAELECLISKHPAVNECGVIGIFHEVYGQLPFAFVVINPERNVSEKDIIRFVDERIVFYKRLHGGCRFINQIPRNATGKILRRKLLEIYKTT